MKRLEQIFGSFRAKIAIMLILPIVVIVGAGDFFIIRIIADAQFSRFKSEIKGLAETTALTVEANLLQSIPMEIRGAQTPEYQQIVEKFNRIKTAIPAIQAIYVLAKKEGQPENLFFVVGTPHQISESSSVQRFVAPGEKYGLEEFPGAALAFAVPFAEMKLHTDGFGNKCLSGYAPVRDAGGKAIAIVGLDFSAADIVSLQHRIQKQISMMLAGALVLAVMLGLSVSREITAPVQQLVEGTRNIMNGNLEYRVKISGTDEIAELARSFNKMAGSLSASQRMVHSYFYRTVRTLVTILEARDPYTKGHSERVAKYAERIAMKLGLPQERIDSLKEIALLHDIGKFGIEENILNKKDKLSEDEWETIRKHPLIGDEILKPIFLNKELLTIVREHHERYDGTGYPYRLSGENINICAQILSVADAYDAMTSPRAYRPAMKREEAVAELKQNKGTQFNPKVVDAFIAMLEETHWNLNT
jgi:putative nucleotidyltransferase with HDIG domain